MINNQHTPKNRYPATWLGMGILLIFLLSGCSDDSTTTSAEDPDSNLRTRFNLQTLGEIPYPPDNPPVQERIALGRLIYFDPILGGEKDVACATCHHPNFAFADLRQFAAGVSGSGLGPNRILSNSAVSGAPIELVPRSSPTVFNTAFNGDETGQPSHRGLQFWDGRRAGLEEQASGPIASRIEMRGDAYPGTNAEAEAAALDSVIARLRAIPEYIDRFRLAFPEEAAGIPAGDPAIIDSANYVRAIAAYERELVTRNSAYDRYVLGDDNALNSQQKHGLELFYEKAKCVECHSSPMFSNFSFVVHGTPQEGGGKSVIPGDDCGREEHTLNADDRYAFRVPSLRNVELTAPYMHDGVFESLEEVVRFHNDGAQPRHSAITDEMLDERLREPLGLTNDEVLAVAAFLRALTDPGTALPAYLMTVPQQVPSGLTPVFGVSDPGSGKK